MNARPQVEVQERREPEKMMKGVGQQARAAEEAVSLTVDGGDEFVSQLSRPAPIVLVLSDFPPLPLSLSSSPSFKILPKPGTQSSLMTASSHRVTLSQRGLCMYDICKDMVRMQIIHGEKMIDGVSCWIRDSEGVEQMSGDKDLKHCMHKLTESRNMNDISVYCIIKATSSKAIQRS